MKSYPLFILMLWSGYSFLGGPRAWSKASESKTLIREWKEIDNKIRNLSKKEAELMNEKLTLELAVSETTETIKSLSSVIHEKRNITISQIRYLNRNSGNDLLRNLIESRNPGELERNNRFLITTTRFNLDSIRQYNKDLQRLELERNRFSGRIAKLNNLQRSLKAQEEVFSTELKNKGLVINKIRRKIKSNNQKLQYDLELAMKNKNYSKISLYRSLLNKNFLDRKGQLTSPTDANIKYPFGVIKFDGISPTLPIHGVLFEAPEGSNVRAIADGTIEWIGTIPGLGETIILDHGLELRSIYARVRLANRRIGEMISEGTSLGQVRNANLQLGKGLYFEIREGSLPTDPLRWILTKSELFTKDSNQWENVQ